MTYYEELGLDARASSDQIRAAYRELARILHPDRQRQARARALANIQMHRLNAIVETLNDAALRAAYDRSLASREISAKRDTTKAARSNAIPNRVSAAVWTVTLALALLSAFLFFRSDLAQGPISRPVVWEPAATRYQEQLADRARIDSMQNELNTLRRQLHVLRRHVHPRRREQ